MRIHQIANWLPVEFQPPKKAEKPRRAKAAPQTEEPSPTARAPLPEFEDDDPPPERTDILA